MAADAPEDHDHDSSGQIEEQFQVALDEGLNPGGPDVLYDLAAGLGLAADAAVMDVGCGAGRHSIRLARRLGGSAARRHGTRSRPRPAVYPARYISQFGPGNYDLALGDCLWHIYRMIGKLSGRVYLLTAL